MRENPIAWYRITGAIAVIALLIYYVPKIASRFKKLETSLDYWKVKSFKTDTIVKVIYLQPQSQGTYIPPRIVINYPEVKSSNTIQVNDSFFRVYDSLSREIVKGKTEFLKSYPKSSKLLYADFTPDSIRLDLFGTDAKIITQSYSTNYLKYRYQYVNGTFRAIALTQTLIPQQNRKINQQIRLGLGYELISNSPYVSPRYVIGNRLNLEISPKIPLNSLGKSQINTEISYRIWGN